MAQLAALQAELAAQQAELEGIAGLANLQRTCTHWLPGRHHIEVVDLLENPRLAADDQIVAVPTLVRTHPPPIRKIVGDLSDTERLLFGMQLLPGASTPR